MAEGKVKMGFFKRIVKFFKDYKSETKKIVWSSKKETIKNTSVVVFVIAVFGVFIALLDWGLASLISII